MEEEELQEEMKSLIEQGLRNETPWQRRMREKKLRNYEIKYRLARHEFKDQLGALLYMVLGPPILLVAIVISGIMMYAAFGWFAAIPSWAALIIFLLVLILLK
jgi:hypothetical protein